MSTCCCNELILLTSSRLIKFSNSNTTFLRLILRPLNHSPWARSQVGSTKNIPDSSVVIVLELTCTVCWVFNRIGVLFGWFSCKSWPEHFSTPVCTPHQWKNLAALLVCTDNNVNFSHCSP